MLIEKEIVKNLTQIKKETFCASKPSKLRKTQLITYFFFFF